MSAHPNIESLRELITRDQAFFKAQSQRISEIQQSDPNALSDSDKSALANWDRSVVTDCDRQLLRLEEIKKPTAEERAIMKELNNLITLGDHIMERRNLVHAELNDRLNAMKKAKATKRTPTGIKKAESVATPLQETSMDVKTAANAGIDTSSPSNIPTAIPSASLSLQTTPTPKDNDTNNVEDTNDDTEVVNRKILYEMLKVGPDATLNDIKKAAKKATLRLHPDRNLDDPSAASRFVDFQAACQIFESGETRQEFDNTGDVEEIRDLQTRLRGLVLD